MSLIEVYYEPLRFLYRSQGAEITAWLGFDLTGKFIEQCANPRWAARTLEQLRDVVITGAPAIAWHLDEMVGHQCWNIEALVLPISRDGTNLDMLISAVERHRHDADKHGRLVAAPLPRKPAHATLRAP
ncbi:MAG: hypothetical protein ACREE3_06230 [Stellaceae bacterium]